MMSHSWSGRPQTPGAICTGKLFWIWGAYAVGMLWMSQWLEAIAVPPAVVWAIAAAIGLCVAACTREF